MHDEGIVTRESPTPSKSLGFRSAIVDGACLSAYAAFRRRGDFSRRPGAPDRMFFAPTTSAWSKYPHSSHRNTSILIRFFLLNHLPI